MGAVCPRCRLEVATAPPSAVPLAVPLPRCPKDGYALVAPEALAQSDGDPFLGLTIANRFVVTSKLGAGSMGTVYRARQEAVGRDVAVKILRTDRALDAMAKARFVREARALSLLASVHTVTVFDFGEVIDPSADELAPVEASLFLAMELLEGESLGDLLRRRERLAQDEALRIARGVLVSLAEAHEKGVIHRDLKPDNIFLARAADGGRVVKLLDFGIAKVGVGGGSGAGVGARGVDALETQAGTVFGTPRYMSPEQAQGKELDARSDLYTLGVLLYHMVVGHAPFVDDDAVVVMARHIKTPPVPPAEAAKDVAISSALSALIVRVMAKDPDERPPNAKAFLSELDAVSLAIEKSSGTFDAPRSASMSGELAAYVQDGLDAAHASRAVRRFGVLVAGCAAIAGGGLALTAYRASITDPLVPARAEIAHLVTERRLALLRGDALATPAAPSPTLTPNAAAPVASSPLAPVPATGAPAVSAPVLLNAPRAGRRYRKFDP